MTVRALLTDAKGFEAAIHHACFIPPALTHTIVGTSQDKTVTLALRNVFALPFLLQPNRQHCESLLGHPSL
jgi:hypothetical protein